MCGGSVCCGQYACNISNLALTRFYIKFNMNILYNKESSCIFRLHLICKKEIKLRLELSYIVGCDVSEKLVVYEDNKIHDIFFVKLF